MFPTPERILKYIGRPYEDYNCFDLVKDFYQDFFSLDLRHYYEGLDVPDRDQIQSLVVSGIGDFDRSEIPQFGDLVVINLHGYACHIGVWLPENKLLHTIKGVGSCIEPVKKYARLLDGYYRHRPLEELKP